LSDTSDEGNDQVQAVWIDLDDQTLDSINNYDDWLHIWATRVPHLLNHVPDRFITHGSPAPELVSAPEPTPRIGVEIVEGVMFGEPVFIGTGTPLMSVVSRVVEGMFDDDIITDFPQVTSEHIRFARWLVRSFSHYRSK